MSANDVCAWAESVFVLKKKKVSKDDVTAYLPERENCHRVKLKWCTFSSHPFCSTSCWHSNVVLFPFHVSLSCALRKKGNVSQTWSIIPEECSTPELKVFFTIIPVLRDNKKQCQDQIVNKTWSHPLCSFFVVFGLWTDTLKHAWFCYFGILIYFLWEYVPPFSYRFK